MSDFSPHALLVRRLAEHMQSTATPFYRDLDEFFKVSILTRALVSRSVPVRQCRTVWSNQPEERMDWVLHSLLLDGIHYGPSAEVGLLGCAKLQVEDVDLENGWSGRVETMDDVIASYAKPGSDLQGTLEAHAASAMAFLDGLELEERAPALRSTKPSFRL